MRIGIWQKVTKIIYESFNLIVIIEGEGGYFAIILNPNVQKSLYPLNFLSYGSLNVLLNFDRCEKIIVKPVI